MRPKLHPNRRLNKPLQPTGFVGGCSGRDRGGGRKSGNPNALSMRKWIG